MELELKISAVPQLAVYIDYLPPELKRIIYSFTYGNEYMDYEKFCKYYMRALGDYEKLGVISPYEMDVTTMNEKWEQFVVDNSRFPEVKILIWDTNHDILTLLSWTMDKYGAAQLADMMRKYLSTTRNPDVNFRIRELYYDYFYRDWIRPHGRRRYYYWEDDSCDTYKFFQEASTIVLDVYADITFSKELYELVRCMLFMYENSQFYYKCHMPFALHYE